jgi:hypothetical protein
MPLQWCVVSFIAFHVDVLEMLVRIVGGIIRPGVCHGRV